MGGPACGLWIPSGSRDAVDLAVERMVRLIARPSPYLSPRSFNAPDTRPIGGRLNDCAAPMYCSFDSCEANEEDELQVAEAFGFWPEQLPLSIGVCCKSRGDHRALADVAAHLVEASGGVIDFGALLPVAAELPGRTAVVYQDGIPGWLPRTMLDAVAMRAWSGRADCWMVK